MDLTIRESRTWPQTAIATLPGTGPSSGNIARRWSTSKLRDSSLARLPAQDSRRNRSPIWSGRSAGPGKPSRPMRNRCCDLGRRTIEASPASPGADGMDLTLEWHWLFGTAHRRRPRQRNSRTRMPWGRWRQGARLLCRAAVRPSYLTISRLKNRLRARWRPV